EREHDPRRPQGEEDDQGEGTIKGKERFTTAPREQPRRAAPRLPRRPVEETGQADPPAPPPRQDDRLERVPEHYGEQDGARHPRNPAHACKVRASVSAGEPPER